jgi:hypothetical protein
MSTQALSSTATPSTPTAATAEANGKVTAAQAETASVRSQDSDRKEACYQALQRLNADWGRFGVALLSHDPLVDSYKPSTDSVLGDLQDQCFKGLSTTVTT